MDTEQLRELERSGLRAWPALESHQIEGWILRASNGFTGRANSAQPLGAVSEPEAAIDLVEQWYADRRLPGRFRLSALCTPENLDSLLESRGYARESETLVQITQIQGFPVGDPGDLNLAVQPSEEWLDVYEEGSGRRDRANCLALFACLPRQRIFASRLESGRTASCGLGVVDNRVLWLFDVATYPELQGRGHAKAVVKALIAWGINKGATRAALQVAATNLAALTLYRGLGFETVMSYHYRLRR